MERVPVRSSNLASVGYDSKLLVLEIQFINGSVYQYMSVPEVIHSELMSAPSKGRYLHRVIKPGYACRPVLRRN